MWTKTKPTKPGRYGWRPDKRPWRTVEQQPESLELVEYRGKLVIERSCADIDPSRGEWWDAPIVMPWEAKPEPVNAELLAAAKLAFRRLVTLVEGGDALDDDAVAAGKLEVAITRAESHPVADLERMQAALNKIARWECGAEVDGSFDDPWSAKLARAALLPSPTIPTE